MKRLLAIPLLALAGILMTACGSGSPQAVESTPIPTVVADKSIVTEGRIEPAQFADLAFNSGGVVGEILVAEGEQISTGQVIARLENSEAKQAEVASAEEAYLLAEQAFNGAEAEALRNLADAHEGVRKAQYAMDNFDIPSDFYEMGPQESLKFTVVKLEDARQAYEPYRYWNPNNGTAKEFKKRLDDAWAEYNKAIQWTTLEADLESAKSNLDHAQKEFDNLSSEIGSGEMAVAQAKYEAARSNLEAARAALADVELRAPFDGTVASLKVKVGETVNMGQVVVTLADFSNWIVKTTDLTELDVVEIVTGQAATVTLDAIPGTTLNGAVKSIGETYAQQQGDVVYEVTVELNETLPVMRWGMTAAVKFEE